jgi:hypothetical protein
MLDLFVGLLVSSRLDGLSRGRFSFLTLSLMIFASGGSLRRHST